MQATYCVVTDRGGHLHNALMLIEQLGSQPSAIVTTFGPDIESLKKHAANVYEVPYLFQWIGKLRIFNPLRLLTHAWVSLHLALRIRPKKVISLGASNAVLFCYWARLLGAEIYHVECMNQVVNPSITGRLLYPICQVVYVQWQELLSAYGPKAQYQGWVL